MKAIYIKQIYADCGDVVMSFKPQVMVVDIENSLSEFQRILGCPTIDIQSRTVNGKDYDFVCDDNALTNKVSIITVESKSNSDKNLIGNIIICNHDGQGNEASLSDDDVKMLLSNVGEFSFVID